MLLNNAIVAAICGSTLVSLPSFCQEDPMSKADISYEACMPFVENTNPSGAHQSVSANYGPLGGYRLFFNKRSGVELSYGYTHNTQADRRDSGSTGVKNRFGEVFAGFVFQPLHPAKRWSPVVAPSAAIFDPRIVRGAATQTQGGHLYGSASDFSPKHRNFPRTEHRGVFYNSSTFNTYGLNGLDRFSNREKPAVVFGYTF
jgi:hypothetical protein